jgi:hypothetical protein
MSSTKGSGRKPAAGYNPQAEGGMWMETREFAKQRDKRRAANKAARKARKNGR